MKRSNVGRVIADSLKRTKLLLAVLGVLVVAAMFLELLPPLLIRWIIDRKLAPGIAKGLWPLAAGYLGALVMVQVVAFLQNYTTTLAGQNILHDLRRAVADKLRWLPLRYYDENPAGEIMSRCTADVEAVNTLFSSGVVGIIADSFRALGIIAAMAALSLRLSLVVFPILAAVVIVAEYFRRKIRLAQRDTRRAVGLINANFQESLAGAKVIHAFRQESRFVAILQRSLTKFLAATTKASLYNSFLTPVMDLLRAGSIGALLWFGAASFGTGGSISLGTLVAFVQLIARLFAPITSLSDEYQTIQEALAGVDRIDEVLGQPVEERPAWSALPAARSGRIVIKDLSFSYHDGSPVLKELNLIIAPGARVAIVGRTGAGKTTLMSLLAGIYAPTQGWLTVDGMDPRRVHPADRRRLLGVVPQQVRLFEGTIRDNIVLGDETIDDGMVERALTIAGLMPLVSCLPMGPSTALGAGGTKLSHGQEQLLSLARALVLEPTVLLLDEPSSGLDAETERTLFRVIQEESRKRTTITISHRLSGAIEADRVLVMSGGRIVQDGPPEELLRSEGWYTVFKTLDSLGWTANGG